jgi:GDPmannose 4,6-dehydratase
VTRKISRAVARISLGLQDKLVLGNLEACRDWGFAGDYVRAMWLMLQQEEPEDLVIATGETHSVGQFCERAFGEVDLDWREYVETSSRFHRPAEVDQLVGDATRARERLGWQSELSFEDLVRRMVTWDLHRVRQIEEQSHTKAPDLSR